MPPPNTKAHMLVRMFDDDESETKGEAMRRRVKNKTFVRRDNRGRVVSEQKITQDKGKPPRVPPRDPRPQQPPPAGPKLTKEERAAKRAADLERVKRDHGVDP